jgi:PAS domain S-box-containing protein
LIAPEPHPEESERLQRLRELGVLDTAPEAAFDRVTQLATKLFDVPIALVSLIDANRQWFKSRQGLDATETPRNISFCGHAVALGDLLVIEDAALDPRFADNPLVTGPPYIRFYAGAPLHSDDGLPLGTLCIIDRKPRTFGPEERELLLNVAPLAESELRRRRVLDTVARHLGHDRQLRTILWLLPDAAFACNGAGVIVTANPAARQLFGSRLRDMLGKPAESLFADAADHATETTHGSGKIRQCRRGDGSIFPGRVKWRQFQVEGADLAIFTVRDVSEWLDRERRLAEQAKLLDMASDAVIVTDSRNVIMSWNTGAERMYGFTREEAVGRDMGELVAVEDGSSREERFAQVLQGSGYWQGDLVHHRADGSRLTVFSRWSASRDALDGVRVLKINTDITERREVERMKDEFIAVVNHELRTPLTAILGSLELLLEYPPGEMGPEPRELIEMSHRSTARLSRLVNDVLDIEKIASGKMTYRREEVGVAEIVRDSVDCVRGELERYGVRVECKGLSEDATVRVMADRDRLVQVITNLLSNAVKFSPRGETVTLDTGMRAGRVRISVADRGPGIPEEFAERIFQRFAQAETPMSRTKQGTGLGLAICKGIMTAMGGDIGYESVVGRGATFHIELPAA